MLYFNIGRRLERCAFTLFGHDLPVNRFRDIERLAVGMCA
jgi:hypothetical protein